MSKRKPSKTPGKPERRVMVTHSDLRTPPDLRSLSRAVIAIAKQKKEEEEREVQQGAETVDGATKHEDPP